MISGGSYVTSHRYGELTWYRSIGRYLEHALNLVIMTGIDYDPRRSDLLHTLVLDIEQAIKIEFIDARFVESILMDDPDSVSILPDALAAISQPSIVAISVRVPFERLARAGRTLEAIREAAADPRHSVFFVVDDAGETERLTGLLADVLDRRRFGYRAVGTRDDVRKKRALDAAQDAPAELPASETFRKPGNLSMIDTAG